MTSFHDPDAAIAKVQRDIELAAQRAERAQQVKAQIDAVRGRGRSPRGEVVVEVDASGQLRDVVLTDAAMDLRHDELSRHIVEAARAAQREAGGRAVAIMGEAYGEESPLTEHLRAEVEQRYA
ncbi:YbaB/EbfC family nucleoid-associated protein [Actinotalea solisilvae]|uniref:YbaB/EbfC family nucleoid-associated protein n=1 Tax=Actinotalea solisilvae TaxID=2072922 RepID=UPI0018F1F4D8|nr:YbaB/EbfC family nucleoid-associated protein [Actinotalea solisilvae]